MLSSRSLFHWPRGLMMALAVVGCAGAVAQNIDVTKEEFKVETPSPFAPAKKAAPMVETTPVVAPVVVVPEPSPAPPPAPAFLLKKDQPIHEGLQEWAVASGWELLWYPTMSWRTVRDANLSREADVVAAVSKVIDILRDEGKPVRLKISDGNKVMEVLSNEVRND